MFLRTTIWTISFIIKLAFGNPETVYFLSVCKFHIADGQVVHASALLALKMRMLCNVRIIAHVLVINVDFKNSALFGK